MGRLASPPTPKDMPGEVFPVGPYAYRDDVIAHALPAG
jgi:hypothetical protein